MIGLGFSQLEPKSYSLSFLLGMFENSVFIDSVGLIRTSEFLISLLIQMFAAATWRYLWIASGEPGFHQG